MTEREAGQPRMLLVEDDPDLRDALVWILEDEGFALQVAASAEAALGVLETDAKRPDLALVDIALPGMDGFAFVRHMRSRPDLAAIPVIGMSAQERSTRHRELGLVAFIEKPFVMNELVALIRQVLAAAATT